MVQHAPDGDVERTRISLHLLDNRGFIILGILIDR